MNAAPRWLGWVGLLLALYNFGQAKPQWKYTRTEHFEMYTCASERESRALLNDLEQFREGFRTAFSLPLTGEALARIILFDSREQFEPYMPLYDGKVKKVRGYCSAQPQGTIIALFADLDWVNTSRTIFHEYVHRMIQERGWRPPVWLNEGLAVVYQTAVINRNTIRLGEPYAPYLGMLRRRQLMPLATLVNVTTSSPEYNESDTMRPFYASAWAFTHYLVRGADRSNGPKLMRYLSLMEEPKADPEVSFRAAFGKGYAEMQAEVERYLVSGKFFVTEGKVAFPDLMDSIQFKPVDDVSRDVALEQLRWAARSRRQPPKAGMALASPNRSRTGDAELDSASRLRDIAARAPDSPQPYEALGVLSRFADNNRSEAKSYWTKAVELGSVNPVVYLQLAKLDLSDIMRWLTLDYRMPPAVADPLRATLDRAIALRPNYYDAWEDLAQVEAIAEKPRYSIVNRIQTLSGEMQSPRTFLALAILRWRMHDTATCEAILRKIDEMKEDKFVTSMVKKLKKRMEKEAAQAAP